MTIQEAARITNISRQTLYRWIEKGLLSKEKDKNLSFVSLAEVQALCNQSDKQDVTDSVTNDNQGVQQDVNRVTVDRAHYDGLLVRLGQYEAERRYLLEYKTGLEAKDKALEQAKGNISAQAQELATVKSTLDANSAELAEAKATISKARNELQRLLELKQDAETKGKALLDQQAALQQRERELIEIRLENERLKRLRWWERLFGRGI